MLSANSQLFPWELPLIRTFSSTFPVSKSASDGERPGTPEPVTVPFLLSTQGLPAAGNKNVRSGGKAKKIKPLARMAYSLD